MHYRRAVEKMRILADECQRTTRWPPDGPFLQAAYVYGDVLDGADPLDCVQVAFALDLPPEDVPWGSHPPGTLWLVDVLRLDKGGFAYCWRSRHEPVENHLIRDPVRFWSLDGPDDAVLDALRDRRFGDLPRTVVDPTQLRQRAEADLDRALAHLRSVHERYWDRDWRREARGLGRYPENELWEATDGYLELLELARREAGDDRD